MPKVISPSIKSQIIKLHLEGRGRNDIAEIMKGQVSSGTISGVLKKCRDNKSNSLQTTSEVEVRKNHLEDNRGQITDSTINTKVDINTSGALLCL